MSPNAIELAYELIKDLKELTAFSFVEPAAVAAALDASREQFDRAYGGGASDAARRITFNVGTITAAPRLT